MGGATRIKKVFMRRLGVILVFALLLGSTSLAMGQVAVPSTKDQIIIMQVRYSDQLMIKLRVLGDVEVRGDLVRLTLPPGQSRLDVEQKIRTWSDIVKWSEPIRYYGLSLPNDPFFGTASLWEQEEQQWYIPKIEANEAWDLSKGQSIVVAVIDTGLDLNHPDLKGQWVQGYNELNPSSPPQDDQGHGTHVSGIISAAMNNQIGIAGIAPASKIMPVKVLDSSGNGDDMDVATGIRWAADHGANIINISLGESINSSGSFDGSTYIAEAVGYAQSKGILVVAAAGNDGVGTISYPATLPGVLSVAATTSENKLTDFSNYGLPLSLEAPGDRILSTYPQASSNGYQYLGGTSMASPMVSAVAALIWSANPTWTSTQVTRKLLTSATDTQTKGWTETQGFGLVNALKGVLPTIQAEAPLPNSYVQDLSQIKARFDSLTMVQSGSIQIALDGVLLPTILTQDEAMSSQTTALVSGLHSIELTYRDISGKARSYAWTFDLETQGLPARLAGQDRIATSLDIAKEGWPKDSATVFLAGYEDWPDALASVPLAFQDNAPVLLTYNSWLDPRLQTELSRLQPSHIVVLGGKGVITDSLVQTLQQLVPQATMERIGGQNRFATAALFAERLKSTSGQAVLSSGLNFADALAVAPFAARQGIPILLSTPNSLPVETQNAYTALRIQQTYAIGGQGVLSDALLKTLKNAQRYGGKDRYATAAAVNQQLMRGSSNGTYFVTNGEQFSDALSIAALAARTGYPLLPVLKGAIPNATAQYFHSLPTPPTREIAVGGTGVVSVLP